MTTRIYTVTCDGRAAAMVRAADKNAAIAVVLDYAEQRNLLGLVGGPRCFAARQPTAAEMAEWNRHRVDPPYLRPADRSLNGAAGPSS